ncbi:hypothetical protein C8J57DRAFT_1517293 [Mycena rebaudengoi]|nr:hypothetical protein C8J57DRAFT_1517293 [Mycena rebaudengoi]
MLGLTLLASLTTANAYVWPSPKLDALEAIRWDQDDTLNGMASFMQPINGHWYQADTRYAHLWAIYQQLIMASTQMHNILSFHPGLTTSVDHAVPAMNTLANQCGAVYDPSLVRIAYDGSSLRTV